MPKLTTLLGWGAAKEAGEKLEGRKKKLDTALSEALGETKPKSKRPKGSFNPTGKKRLRKRLQQGAY